MRGYGLFRGQSIAFSFVDGAYWSLLVEIRFYLLLCVLAYGFKIRSLPLAVATLGLISIFNFPLLVFFKGQDFLIYLPFFAFGLAYREWSEGNSTALYVLFLSFGIFSIQCFLGTNGLSMGLDRSNFTSYSVCFLIFILVMLFWRNSSNSVITYLGIISYPLYLIHQDVGYILISLFGSLATRNSAVILTLAVVVSLASLIDYFTSRGVKRVRFHVGRFFDRNAASFR
jgi:peptidoglycan/LPS O-acetylase OafA/YrhL